MKITVNLKKGLRASEQIIKEIEDQFGGKVVKIRFFKSHERLTLEVKD